ncbi:MAG: AAA family ATPase, partial [Candidatus Acidiferrum sp.]
MHYIFMDNYRGFSETLIPLRRATFLVGENSTGKSSFLSVAYLLSTPAIILGRNFWQGELYNLGGFKDIVSVTSD